MASSEHDDSPREAHVIVVSNPLRAEIQAGKGREPALKTNQESLNGLNGFPSCATLWNSASILQVSNVPLPDPGQKMWRLVEQQPESTQKVMEKHATKGDPNRCGLETGIYIQ